MASEGSFGANQKQAPDKASKIVEAANRKIKGMKENHNFEMQQRDIYLRAMQFAQGQEEKSRETNYRLETENRKQHINAVTQNYQTTIDNARRLEQAANPQAEKLQGLFGLVPQLAGMYAENVERQQTENRQAASVAAYEHGFTLDTLENVLVLNDQLSLAQFQATDYIQGLQQQGWSEDRINALYEFQYKTRGSKAWVDNVALAENSVQQYTFGLNTQIIENGNLSVEDQIAAAKNYTQDFIGNVSINGRPISAEVMSTIIAPKVRSAETKAMNSLQKLRIDTRNVELTAEKNKIYRNAFNLNGSQGLHDLNAIDPSKEKRDEIINFMMNGHKSGAISTDQLNTFINSRFGIEATGKTGTLAEHFIGDEKVADLAIYQRQVETRENTRFEDEQRKLHRQTKSYVANQIIEMQKSGQPITEDMLVGLQKEGEAIVGVKFQSDEIDYAMEFMTPKAQIREATYAQGVKMVEAGMILQDLREFGLTQSQLNQEVNGEPSLQQRANVNEQAKKNPYYVDSKKEIADMIGGHPEVRTNSFVTKEGLTHEENHWNRKYKEKFWQTMNINGQDIDNAHNIALSDVTNGVENYLGKLENTASGLIRYKKFAEAGTNAEVKLSERNKTLSEYRLQRVNKGILAQEIGRELFMDATEAIQSSTKEIPANFRSAAEIYKMTPFEFQQYLAPAFGEDAVEFDATTAQSMLKTFKPERMPLIRNPYGTSARIERFKANAGSLRGAVRGGVNIQKFRNAITTKESTNNYNVVNNDSGAIGIGQVMPANVGPWTQRYLGQTLTPEQFRSSPEAQDAVINGRFMDMISQQTQAGYSVDIAIRRAASEWYSGSPDLYNSTAKQGDGKYPTIASYTLDILDRYYSQ